MKYVYILSEYAEDGAENVCATLDHAKVHSLMEMNWPESDWRRRGQAGLDHLLKKSNEELSSQTDGWNCHEGWGGIQLHVIRLV